MPFSKIDIVKVSGKPRYEKKRKKKPTLDHHEIESNHHGNE